MTNEQHAHPIASTAAMVQSAARAALPPRDDGSTPTSPIQALYIGPIPFPIARALLEQHHYLHSFPGGTCLAFGVFRGHHLRGAVTFGAGPSQAFRLVEGDAPTDCLTLTRLWLSDDLPPNSESRTLGILLRSLRRHTTITFLVTYADPAQDHLGTIYQATNWLYTGLSQATPLYDFGDGKPHTTPAPSPTPSAPVPSPTSPPTGWRSPSSPRPPSTATFISLFLGPFLETPAPRPRAPLSQKERP